MAGKINLVTNKQLQRRTTKKLDNIIYNNFIDLAQEPNLKHTYNEINRLLNSADLRFFTYIYNTKLISYLIAEIMILPDKRKVLFVNYLFSSPKFRGKGIATKLLEAAEHYAKINKFSGIMLTCNTHDISVYEFYLKRGFMLDIYLRQYTKYDVLFKPMDINTKI
jgi:GNAT superfamily N-acetyltransferase